MTTKKAKRAKKAGYVLKTMSNDMVGKYVFLFRKESVEDVVRIISVDLKKHRFGYEVLTGDDLGDHYVAGFDLEQKAHFFESLEDIMAEHKRKMKKWITH